MYNIVGEWRYETQLVIHLTMCTTYIFQITFCRYGLHLFANIKSLGDMTKQNHAAGVTGRTDHVSEDVKGN